MISKEFTHDIIRNAMKVHSQLGPGLLESAYQEALYYFLRKERYYVEKEKPMPVSLEEVQLDCGYRIDLLVEGKLVLELKSVTTLNEVHMAQTLTYLKLGNFKLGLLINFNVAHLRDGIKRVINSNV
jgi:GxxExxY protein